jgi:hypothetical protein
MKLDQDRQQKETFTFSANEMNIIDQALAHYEEFLVTKKIQLNENEFATELSKNLVNAKLKTTNKLINLIPFKTFNL